MAARSDQGRAGLKESAKLSQDNTKRVEATISIRKDARKQSIKRARNRQGREPSWNIARGYRGEATYSSGNTMTLKYGTPILDEYIGEEDEEHDDEEATEKFRSSIDVFNDHSVVMTALVGGKMIYEHRSVEEITREDVVKARQYLYSSSKPAAMLALIYLRILSSKENLLEQTVDMIFEQKMFSKILEFVNPRFPVEIQFEALWIMTNVVDPSKYVRTAVEVGLVDRCIVMLQSEVDDIKNQALWTIANIAGEGVEYRDLVIKKGILTQIKAISSAECSDALYSTLVWLLSNLCRYPDIHPSLKTKAFCQYLCTFIVSDRDDILIDATTAIQKMTMSDGSTEVIDLMMTSTVILRIITLMCHPHFEISMNSIKILGNITYGDSEYSQLFFKHGIMSPIMMLLDVHNPKIHKELCLLISNLAVDDHNQFFAKPGVIERLVHFSKKGLYPVRYEATFALSNLFLYATKEQVEVLLKLKALAPLCEMISPDHRELTSAIIGTVSRLLRLDPVRFPPLIEKIDAVSKIRNVEGCKTHHIALNCSRILTTYFDKDDEEEEAAEEPAGELLSSSAFGDVVFDFSSSSTHEGF
jgi:hypothetical protein